MFKLIETGFFKLLSDKNRCPTQDEESTANAVTKKKKKIGVKNISNSISFCPEKW